MTQTEHIHLFTLGQQHRTEGRVMMDGWKEVCERHKWSPWDRTAAFEAYADGWYSAV